MRTRRLRTPVAIVTIAVALGACSTAESPRDASPARTTQGAAQCPQSRTTERAPDSYLSRTNPLPGTAENLERGRRLFQRDAKPAPCASCHGINGDGNGPAARDLVPPPRNFTCAETMNALPDGQLFWIVENGSGTAHLPPSQGALEVERPARGTPFTAMRDYKDFLSDAEIWQLILYIRTLARDRR